MRLHFRNKMFTSSKMFRFCFVLFLYYFFVKFPYVFGYNSDIIPSINARTILVKIHEIFTFYAFFNMGLTALAATVFARLVSVVASLLYNQITINFTGLSNLIVITKKDLDLDVSNPFLYSYKTKALLE